MNSETFYQAIPVLFVGATWAFWALVLSRPRVRRALSRDVIPPRFRAAVDRANKAFARIVITLILIALAIALVVFAGMMLWAHTVITLLVLILVAIIWHGMTRTN